MTVSQLDRSDRTYSARQGDQLVADPGRNEGNVNFWVVGTDASGQQELQVADGNMPLALVIGRTIC